MSETKETKHTPGLCKLIRKGAAIDIGVEYESDLSPHAYSLIAMCLSGEIPAANARRIAALWNEAERMGLTTEAIEQGVLTELLETVMDLLEQHCFHATASTIRHSFLSTNERAFELLVRLGYMRHVKGEVYELLREGPRVAPSPETGTAATKMEE